MATELGKAYVQIVPSAKGISGAIQGQLNPEASAAGVSAGEGLGGKLVSAVKGIIATAAIGKAIGASLSAGADLQQSLGGVETLFKGSADKVKAYADEAYRTTGLSANSYMESVTSFSASLLQSVSGDTEKAADKANMAMVDMSDNANKMGTSMGDIQNAYQGFAKQNYTMLDNLKLGYGGTKTEMERLLADATKLTGVKYDINNLSDVYDAIHVVQEELDITGTTAKESAETFSGSLASMKASFTNFLGNLSLGRDVKPSLQALAETVSTFVFGNLLPMVGNILTALPGAIVTFVTTAGPMFMQAGSQMLSQIASGITEGMPNFINSFQGIITSIMAWITTNLPTLLNAGVQILTDIANGILQAIPSLITVAGNLISTFLTFIWTNLPTILEAGKNLLLNLIDGIISNLPAIGSSAIQAVSKFIDTVVQNFPQFLAKGAEILKSLITGILQRLPDLINAAFTLIKDFLSMLVSKLPDIIAGGVKILLSLVSGIIKSIPDLLSAVGKIGSTIVDGISKINLLEAGKAIINGFLKGLKAAFEGVKDFVGGIGTWIKDHKGPIEYDRKLLIPAGNAIMTGLNAGLQDKFRQVQGTIAAITDEMATGFSSTIASEALRGQRLALASGYSVSTQAQRTVEISVPVYLYPNAPREIGYATAKYVEEKNSKESKIRKRVRGEN